MTEGSRNKVNTVLVNAIASVTELNPKPIFLFNIFCTLAVFSQGLAKYRNSMFNKPCFNVGKSTECAWVMMSEGCI